MGQGPMTGRGAGFCAGYSTAGYENHYPGLGRFCKAFRGDRQTGFMRGLRWKESADYYQNRGWKNFQNNEFAYDKEKESLKQELEELKLKQEDITKRLQNLN
mgnify:FL=1